MAQLACPNCGEPDSLLSVERVHKAYPVTITEDPAAAGRAAIVSRPGTPEVWDENPEPTGMIHCDACGSSSGRGTLVPVTP